MVNETPIVELDHCMCTGPTANCLWSLDDKPFFSIDQLIDQMREKDTLKSHSPDVFNQVQRATHVSSRNLCNSLRPIVNTQGVFTIDEQALLAPQLIENNDWANTQARHARGGFFEQLQQHVAENPRKCSDEDQS